MSCCDGIEMVKTEDFSRSYLFPSTYDFTGWAPEMRIALEEGSPVLLSVGLAASANGSQATVTGRSLNFLIKMADLQMLPDGTPDADPWYGVVAAYVTSPSGITSRIEQAPLSVEKGV